MELLCAFMYEVKFRKLNRNKSLIRNNLEVSEIKC